jgi:Zn-dependent membrane protease YugP
MPFFMSIEMMLFLLPAFILGLWAQARVRSTYMRAQQQPARLSGAAAARHLLNEAGLHDVPIEQVPGELSDHYDPRHRVLRLSGPVYNGRNLAAVGIAAHEAGHALQHAHQYLPLTVRNAAVPAANLGSNAGMLILIAGIIMAQPWLIWAGIGLFSAVVFFQVVNLPVEFNASSRAKALLVERGIVPADEMVYVRKVLNAAALTYVAATLQSILTLLYYVLRYTNSRD